jgi:hypothetical protein
MRRDSAPHFLCLLSWFQIWYHVNMTKREKLLQKLLALPTEMRYSEVFKLLEAHGFMFDHAGKNHNVFTDGKTVLNIPTVSGRAVKRIYLLRIIMALGYGKESS